MRADTPAGSARRPPGTRNGLCARAARVPAPPSRALGAGLAGGGSCDTAREAARAGRPPPHPPPPPPPSPGLSQRSGARAEPRAPRARAEQGTEPWRTRRASTVRADGGRAGGRGSPPAAAPPPRLPAPVSSRAPARGSFLFSFAAARRLGWHIWGEGGSLCRVGSGCACRYPAGAEVSVLCVPMGVDVPVCAHLWVCVPLWGRVHPDAHIWGSVHACSLALCVQPALCVPSWVHIH